MSVPLAAISFDPTIRGILVILVGAVVLVGSIYLIVTTNTGPRLGFLVVGAGLFGWMSLMGIVWWMYGIGLIGRSPSWMTREINLTREDPVATDVVRRLPNPDTLPDPRELLAEQPVLEAVFKGSEGKDYAPKSLSNLVTLATPLVLAKTADVTATIRPNVEEKAAAVLASSPEAAEAFGLGDTQLADRIAREAEALRSSIEERLGGWCMLAESDPRRGEAVAAADAELAAESIYGDNTTPANYLVKDVFFSGGKEPCTPITEKSTLGQAWQRIKTTVQVKNPRLWGVVTVVKARQAPAVEGQAPPPPTAEPGATTVSVIMERNLGNKRFIPFMFTLANLLLFGVFASVLHSRDKKAMAARAAAGR